MNPAVHLVRVLAPVVLLTTVLCWAMITGYGMLGVLTLAAGGVLLLVAMRSVLNGAEWPGTNTSMQRRKELAAAREFCRDELRSATPALDDSWYPYLLAFGLGRHVERWFRAFGGPSAVPHTRSASIRSGSGDVSTGSGGSGFSGFGGGGGFSGAGATVEFGAAVGAFASGISAPSSSSSGGGSSSSGGSSGGGGGGGW